MPPLLLPLLLPPNAKTGAGAGAAANVAALAPPKLNPVPPAISKSLPLPLPPLVLRPNVKAGAVDVLNPKLNPVPLVGVVPSLPPNAKLLGAGAGAIAVPNGRAPAVLPKLNPVPLPLLPPPNTKAHKAF